MHQAIAENNLDVKVFCVLAGLTTGYGPSRHAAEHLALMCAMSNMTVIDPCDALDTAKQTSVESAASTGRSLTSRRTRPT
jgi:transketolase